VLNRIAAARRLLVAALDREPTLAELAVRTRIPEDKIARAEIIDPSKLSGNTVKFGATVGLEDEESGDKVKYKIVGEDEANLREGKISINSPIARALIGKSKGESAEVTTPKGARSYEILKVEFK